MFSSSKESLAGSGSCVCVSVRCRNVRWRREHKHSRLFGGNPDLGGHGAAENTPVCNDTFPSVPTVHDTQLVPLSRVPLSVHFGDSAGMDTECELSYFL